MPFLTDATGRGVSTAPPRPDADKPAPRNDGFDDPHAKNPRGRMKAAEAAGLSRRPNKRVARSNATYSGLRQAMEFEGRPTEGTNGRSKTAMSEGWGPARPRVGTLGRQRVPAFESQTHSGVSRPWGIAA
jgi:hypothetical protein